MNAAVDLSSPDEGDEDIECELPPLSVLAKGIPVFVDMPGLLFVDACKRIDRGAAHLQRLHERLIEHRERLATAQSNSSLEEDEHAWSDLMHGVASLESIFGATITAFAVADVLLVAAAESYINSIAAEVLESRDEQHFERLGPVGKWLILPSLMKLDWQPTLDRGPLQEFSKLVKRRNRVVHPRVIKVRGATEIDRFAKTLELDAKSAVRGSNAVREQISGISMSWRGSHGPSWLTFGKARRRPPCFYLLSMSAPMRLERLRRRSKTRGT